MISKALTQTLIGKRKLSDFQQKPKDRFFYEVIIPGRWVRINGKNFLCKHENLHRGTQGGVKIIRKDHEIGDVRDIIYNSFYTDIDIDKL